MQMMQMRVHIIIKTLILAMSLNSPSPESSSEYPVTAAAAAAAVERSQWSTVKKRGKISFPESEAPCRQDWSTPNELINSTHYHLDNRALSAHQKSFSLSILSRFLNNKTKDNCFRNSLYVPSFAMM